MDRNLIYENVFDAYRFAHASPDIVFEWLKEKKPKLTRVGDAASDTPLDTVEVLIKRDEPEINLGLALYAILEADDVLNLFRNGDTTIKRALMTGPSVASGLRWLGTDHTLTRTLFGLSDEYPKLLKELLQSFDDNLKILAFLFMNEYIDHALLTRLFKRLEPFNTLTDEQWLSALELSSLNLSLSSSSYRERRKLYHDEIELDPLEKFDSAFKAAWELFEILPVNAKSARILSQFGTRLAPFGELNIPEAPYGMNVSELIKRWEIDESAYDKYELTYFRSCQFALRSQLKDEGRTSDWSTPEAIRKAYEKDKEGFLNAALASDYPYTREDLRDELRECCWEYHRDSNDESWRYTNHFDSKCEALQQKHPEWFLDSDGLYGMTLDEIEDVGLRSEIRLERLEDGLKSISQKMQELVEEQTSAALSQIYKAILWVMVIIIVGLIAILTKLY